MPHRKHLSCKRNSCVASATSPFGLTLLILVTSVFSGERPASAAPALGAGPASWLIGVWSNRAQNAPWEAGTTHHFFPDGTYRWEANEHNCIALRERSGRWQLVKKRLTVRIVEEVVDARGRCGAVNAVEGAASWEARKPVKRRVKKRLVQKIGACTPDADTAAKVCRYFGGQLRYRWERSDWKQWEAWTKLLKLKTAASRPAAKASTMAKPAAKPTH